MAEDTKKLCFVIAPVDQPGSPIRKHSDQVLKHIIKRAAEPLEYVVERADEIPEPGRITSQVIGRLLEAPLVVADLTTRNANVFYELAIRHAIRKPLVQLIDVNEPIPFDVATERTIKFTLTDPDSVEAAREALGRHIKAVERDPTLVDNPISAAIDLGALKTSGKSGDAQLAAILEALGHLQSEVAMLRNPYGPTVVRLPGGGEGLFLPGSGARATLAAGGSIPWSSISLTKPEEKPNKEQG